MIFLFKFNCEFSVVRLVLILLKFLILKLRGSIGEVRDSH